MDCFGSGMSGHAVQGALEIVASSCTPAPLLACTGFSGENPRCKLVFYEGSPVRRPALPTPFDTISSLLL
eukprot:4105283-Amphidinium_carterae.2